ncbi:MAG: hypothetical protein U0R26_09985, partial [Solirubrobacterales bacterium]
ASTAVQCFDTQAAETAFFHGSAIRKVDGFPVGSDQMKTWIDRYRGFGARCRRRNGKLRVHVVTLGTSPLD